MRRAFVPALLLMSAIACGSSFGSSSDDSPPPPVDAGVVTQDSAPVVAAESGADVNVAAPDAGPSSFPEAVQALPGLIGYWRMNDVDSGTVHDSKGTNHGTLKLVFQAPGLLPDGGEGDAGAGGFGTGASVDITSKATGLNLQRFGQKLTLGVLFQPTALGNGADQYLALKYDAWSLGIDTSNRVFAAVSREGGAIPQRLPSSTMVTSNVTALAILTYDVSTGEQKLYLNGAGTVLPDQKLLAKVNDQDLWLGGLASLNTTTTSGWFYGFIDEVFIAESTITEADVATLSTLAGVKP